VYAQNGRTVTYVMREEWCWDPAQPESCPTDYAVTRIEHDRYDGPRHRYLPRVLDPVNLFEVEEELWSDYDGDSVYADFTISGGAGSTVRSFEPGIARVQSGVSQGSGWTDYYHADHLGTTRRMTAPNGSVIESSAFTAFGERSAGSVSGPEDRYAYVGAWGYQADADFDILHVGHRYYDPETGRFLQRDPIGIEDDLNVYTYVGDIPTIFVDPTGEAYKHKTGRLSNRGRLRYGPSRPQGAPPSVRKPAFRWGPKGSSPHIWGKAGAGTVVGLCVASAAAGAVTGRVIDNTHGRYNNGYRISDGLADIIFRWRHGSSPGYDPWGQ